MKHKKGYQSLQLIKKIKERVNRHAEQRNINPISWMVTGGIAVDAYDGGVVKDEYRNIDLMAYKRDSKKFKEVLEGCGVTLLRRDNPRNVHGVYEGIDVDVIILYYINRIGYIFETPYHNPGAPIPKRFLEPETVSIKHKELGNVKFPALNATALYLAKITTKDRDEKSEKDALRIARKVDPKLKTKAHAFARPC